MNAITQLRDFIWGPYLLIPLLFASGIYLTLRLRGIQFWTLPHALWLAFVLREEGDDREGDISHFEALTTALAATIGVGNIAGVATGIGIGGPGALFWMFVTGVLGMAAKYSEALLGVKYRRRDAMGEQSGGPMLYLHEGFAERGMGGLGKVLGLSFAVFGAIAAFGIGNMSQANSVSVQLHDTWGVPLWLTGATMTVLLAAVALGGIKSIGRVAAVVVPFMCVAFTVSNLLVLVVMADRIPGAIVEIVSDAFTGTAATGGFVGSTVLVAIQLGFARGIFSNESGLGTGAIAAAAAKTDQPVRQAMVSMTQTFVDTVVMLTLTGLMIVATDAWKAEGVAGPTMTSLAISTGFARISPALAPWGSYVVAVGVVFFAFCTILGWSYYGERCMEFLFGRGAVQPYRVVFLLFAFVGAVLELDLVWVFSDMANGLMALPNLLGLLVLSPVVVKESWKYFANPKWRDAEATYES